MSQLLPSQMMPSRSEFAGVTTVGKRAHRAIQNQTIRKLSKTQRLPSGHVIAKEVTVAETAIQAEALMVAQMMAGVVVGSL